ncbi:histidinol dehydrogenase [candidate division MSBL1 archaeon SCGC-AAA382M17]|uniref:Histidinol dehydrogenase n=1 Tax=candidate division MSBL1 archaeon SCGC-AAA382M17 TaxID=1698284 RepID=A0ABR5TJA0_9EURY|nr:histidinol dehydrogenase [candidate division MSBL1 archaeon SCGC-AAA382M17]
METSPLEVVRLWRVPEGHRKRFLSRSEGDVAEVLPKVREIVKKVRNTGDYALLEFTERFDGVDMTRDQIRVTEEEVSRAFDEMEYGDIDIIREAAKAIERYHRRQMPEEWMEEFEEGISAGQVVRPLDSVGCYAPGGNAQYPSSVLMSVIPAKVSGVKKVSVCTPPNSDRKINSATLVAADFAGADEVYKVGGAQAISAMAYGTKTIPSVDKIVGPGNIYVAAAKRVVSTEVDIDFMAGPSEVLILADSTADPHLIALDLVAQAEHDSSSAAVLVTTSEKLAEDTSSKVKNILEDTRRNRTAGKALQKYGLALIVRTTERAVDFVNDYAPEHLQIMVREPERVLDRIKNAGAIFLGLNSPTSAGDFAVGPSHVLPTGGEARYYDGLNVQDFLRMPSVQKISKKGLEKISEVIERISELEGLPAHARSVRDRVED